jgi:hypothetical protein
VMMGYQIPLKVALCTPETGSGVVLVHEFKSQQERDQLRAALENEEHHGRT